MAYYDREEQETVIIYEPATGMWDIYTTVPKHINRLKTEAITTISDTETDAEGKTIAFRLKMEKLPSSYVFNR